MKRNRNRQYFMKVNRHRSSLVRSRQRQANRERSLEQKSPTEAETQRANKLLTLNELLVKRAGDKITKEIINSFLDEKGRKISAKDARLVSKQLGLQDSLPGKKGGAVKERRLSDELPSEKQSEEGQTKPQERQLSESKDTKTVKSTERQLQQRGLRGRRGRRGRRSRGNNCPPNPQMARPLRQADTFLQIPRPRLRTLQCRRRRSSYFRDYMIVNPRKVRFCYGIYQDFMHYNMAYFNETLVEVKRNMMILGDLRKQFFCSLCDGHAQRFFDHKRKLILYKNDFCSRITSQFLDYLQFMNVLFIEFADSLLQYVQCFETDGNLYNFPFQNFLVKYKRRIPFFKRCFQSVVGEDPAYMKNCWFICNKFSLMRINGIFDGDLPLLTRIRIALFSFLRKLSQQRDVDQRMDREFPQARNVSRIDLGIVENVNGILIEPVSPALLVSNRRFYMGRRDRQNVMGNLTTSGILPLPREVMPQVNSFLSSMNLRSVDELLSVFQRNQEVMNNATIRNRQQESPFDETRHQQSRVNGMINQLWNLQTRQNISSWMMPARKLRQEAIKIIKESGFEAIPRERRLQQFELFPPRATIPPAFSPRNNTIEHFRVSTVDGKRNKTRNPEVPLDAQDRRFMVEFPIEMFEKSSPTIDMYNYGVAFEDSGIDPLAYFYFADFERNVTSVINEHFEKPEKLDGEVLIEYLAYTSRKVNEFNELFDQPVEGFIDIRNRDKRFNRFKSTSNYAAINDRFKLNKVAEGSMKEIAVKTREEEAKKRRDEQRIKLMKKYEKAKMFDSLEQPDLSQHLMTNMPNFHDTFNGMSTFFSKLFGP